MLLSPPRRDAWRYGCCTNSQTAAFLLILALMGQKSYHVLAQTPAASIKPLDCHPGLYYFAEEDRCRPCLQSTYKSTHGPDPCTYCPKDADGQQATTLGDGATSIDSCHFRPHLVSFSPEYGPLAGGTRVNITMAYLTNQTMSRTTFVNVTTTNCTRSGQSFLCYTPPSPVRVSGLITVEMMDSDSEYLDKSLRPFSYRTNPIVSSTIPNNPNTILSGGILITVIGNDFSSVAKPEMIVTRIYMRNNTKHFGSECQVNNNTLMVCPTPELKDDDIFSSKSDLDRKWTRRRRRRQPEVDSHNDREPINNDDLQYLLSFRFDGYSAYNKVNNLSVFHDPVFEMFHGRSSLRYYRVSRDKEILIEGERLDYTVTAEQIDVTIGSDICQVMRLSTNVLTCMPPRSPPSRYGPRGPGPHTSHYVQVTVGNLRFHIGYLKYVNEALVAQELTLTMSILGALLLWLVTLVAAIIWWQQWRSRHRKSLQRSLKTESKMEVATTESSRSSMTSDIESGNLLDTGNGSSNNSEDTATTGVSSLEPGEAVMEVDENAHMMHIDVWSVLEEPLKSKVIQCQIEPHRLTLGECIGVGSFGRVFKGEMEAEDGSKIPVAVKTLRDGFTSAEELPQFLEEGLVMAGFKHDHILPLYGVAVSDCLPFVVSEYMDLGDLRSYVKNASEETITVKICLGLTHQVAEGMVYLSSQGFLHRDLAARNCLINSSGIVKIGDFGLSRDLHGQDYYRVGDMGRPLPVKWMSIESLNLGKFSTKSDVWSFGVLMWELVTRGRTPYYNVNNIDLKDYLNNGKRLSKPPGTPAQVYQIMKKCWQSDPAERPTFVDLLTEIDSIQSFDDDITDTDSNHNVRISLGDHKVKDEDSTAESQLEANDTSSEAESEKDTFTPEINPDYILPLDHTGLELPKRNSNGREVLKPSTDSQKSSPRDGNDIQRHMQDSQLLLA